MVRGYQPHPWRYRIGRVLQGLGSALVLVAVSVGIPWLLVTVAGSPIPDRIPSRDEVVAALSRRDDGTLFLGFLTYMAWGLWLAWVGLVVLEAGARVRGRSAPRIPGLDGPQRLAALLITTLAAAVIGTTASVGRASALPASPQGLVVSTALPHAAPSPTVEGTGDHGSAADVPGQAPFAHRLIDNAAPQTPSAERIVSASRRETHQIAVRFEFDSSELSASAKDTLARTTRDIHANADPARPVVIVGHTDSLGPADYNQRLSVRRARAVRTALGELPAYGYRFEVSGKGERARIAAETQPDGSDDPAGRAHNRRVEITYSLKTSDAPQASPTSRSPQPHERTDGDGSAGTTPAPTAPSQTPSPAPSGSPSSIGTPPSSVAPQQSPAEPSPTQHHPITVDLPSGAVVGLSFAAGVGTALVASRLHRRRRHRTPGTGPQLASGEPPPSPTVRRLRRAELAARESGRTDPASTAEDTGRLHVFPVASSGRIVVGARGDEEAIVAIGGLVLGLSGPGAMGAARSMLLDLVTHAGDHDVEIVISKADAIQLLELASSDIDEIARQIRALTVTPDLDAALRLMESEHVHRARLLDSSDGQDLASVRQADPTEPLPRLVLIASATEEHRQRILALCSAADEHDMCVLLLGESPTGPTVRLDDTGHVTTVAGTDMPWWQGMRMFHLAHDDVREILAVIRSAHGEPEPEPKEPHANSVSAETPAAPPLPPESAETDGPPTRLRVLGPPTLLVGNQELSTGIRGKARELITYLAIYPDGATRDTILEALWPDIDHQHAVMRFHGAVNDLRQQLRRATSRTHSDFITLGADRYRIDPDLISVDLWQFRRTLDAATRAEDDQSRATLLRDAADTYAGNLAAEQSFETPYEWIEPEREAIRRQAIEALTQLAGLQEAGEPERAMAALEQARTIDRYAEETYQKIMILQARLGRLDAIRRTYRLLETTLEELNVDPTLETQELLSRLLDPRSRRTV
jgi:outer membrane protein OmpA-like peptidoglycan-associated protein/DNA-binding SARP family transcriptional activator